MTEQLWSDERIEKLAASGSLDCFDAYRDFLYKMRDEYEANRRQAHKRAGFIGRMFHEALIDAYIKHFDQWARADEYESDMSKLLAERDDLREQLADAIAASQIHGCEMDERFEQLMALGAERDDLAAKLAAANAELHDLRIRAGLAPREVA